MGKIERAHLISRQRVEAAVWSLTHDRELVLLAAWDPRNAVHACEIHHRRFDGHTMPPLTIARAELPGHAEEMIRDWGLESEAKRRFS